MQVYDVVMLAVMAGAILFGLWKGLAWQVASLAAILVSYFVAMQFRAPVADVVSELIEIQAPWNTFLAMFALFIGTSLAIWIVFGFVKRWIERWHLKAFDRQAGGLLGAVKGAVLCILVTLFAASMLGDGTRRSICDSRTGNYIARALPQLGGLVPAEITQVLAPYVTRFNEVMQEHAAETSDEELFSRFTSILPFWPDEEQEPPIGDRAGPDSGLQVRVGPLQIFPVQPGSEREFVGSPASSSGSGIPVSQEGFQLFPSHWRRAVEEALRSAGDR